MQKNPQLTFASITPFLVFIGLFFVPPLLFSFQISAIFACMVAIMYGLFTFSKDTPFNKRIEVFLSGGADTTIIAMLYIFIFSAIFTHILTLLGAIDYAVKLGLSTIPQRFILPGFFTIISIFATAIGSSMGAIAAFAPIAVGIAQKLGISPALMSGIVVSGAMLGDNLSIISDTTIAATQTTGTNMRDKFKENIKFVIPAFIITLASLFAINSNVIVSATDAPLAQADFTRIRMLIPYIVIFGFALAGVDVILTFILGIISALAIGIFNGTFSLAQSTHLIFEGFSQNTSIQEVLVLALLISGLSRMVEFNGGINYLLKKLGGNTKSKSGAELQITILTFLVNAAIAINTIAILITGPVAKKIGDKSGIGPKRVASLIDISACICQGILPYAPQLLLASSIAGISSLQIMPYLHYQWAIAFVTIISIFNTYNLKSS